MTTAHRPTWHPTAGGKDQGGNRVLVPSKQYSSKDLPGHTVLKYRRPGQGTSEELSTIDYKEELLKKEKLHFAEKFKEIEDSSPSSSLRHRSRSRESSEDSEEFENNQKVENSENDENSDSESDFSEEEIRKELEKIRAERAEQERLKREQEELKIREKYKEDLLKGNPLLDTAPGFELKKKWTEETIFKNQSRNEPKAKHRFVNDTLRSDFHRKILSRTIM